MCLVQVNVYLSHDDRDNDSSRGTFDESRVRQTNPSVFVYVARCSGLGPPVVCYHRVSHSDRYFQVDVSDLRVL
jgi:hypothetical protein